jgi:hypothetical protein
MNFISAEWEFTHIWIYAFRGVEQTHVVQADSRLLFHSKEDAGEQVYGHHGDEQQPPDLEHRRPTIQNGIVFDDSAKQRHVTQ